MSSAKESGIELAVVISAYYRELIKGGIPKNLAAELVTAVHNVLILSTLKPGVAIESPERPRVSGPNNNWN